MQLIKLLESPAVNYCTLIKFPETSELIEKVIYLEVSMIMVMREHVSIVVCDMPRTHLINH